jgi:hypothetical protein
MGLPTWGGRWQCTPSTKTFCVTLACNSQLACVASQLPGRRSKKTLEVSCSAAVTSCHPVRAANSVRCGCTEPHFHHLLWQCRQMPVFANSRFVRCERGPSRTPQYPRLSYTVPTLPVKRNVAVEWLALLLAVREVPGSCPGPVKDIVWCSVVFSSPSR